MNGTCSKTRRLLGDPGVQTVVVEHRDRLGRMNTELVQAALSAPGRRLVVLEPNEVDDDLVRDITEVLTSFCARLYDRRSARNGKGATVRALGHWPREPSGSAVTRAPQGTAAPAES
jgi:putative resolvase